MLTALIGRSIGRARGLLMGLVVLLCGFQLLMVMVAREIQQSQAFSAIAVLMPAAFQQMTGGLFFGSFSGLALFGFVHPIVVLVLVEAAIFLASEPAWDVEAGLVDMTMARLALHAFTPTGVPVPPLRTSVLLAVNLTAVSWWFGSFSLLVASVARRRSAVLGAAGLMAVFLYLLNLVAEIWSKARGFRFLTPFHYYNAPTLIRGSNQQWPADIALLLGTAAVLCVAAWQVYLRRDL